MILQTHEIRELIRERHPDAYAEDDHRGWVEIKTQNKKVTSQSCHTRNQPRQIIKKLRKIRILGGGKYSELAWANAAKNLGLTQNQPLD